MVGGWLPKLVKCETMWIWKGLHLANGYIDVFLFSEKEWTIFIKEHLSYFNFLYDIYMEIYSWLVTFRP